MRYSTGADRRAQVALAMQPASLSWLGNYSGLSTTHEKHRIPPFSEPRGPNIWTYRSALEVWIDIGELEDFPSNTIPGFVDRLTTWLPTLIEHRCSYEERGGFVRRLHEGTWPGHILEHVTLELQNLAGCPAASARRAKPMCAASTRWWCVPAMKQSPAQPSSPPVTW
jgi:hypothetical protein